MYLLVAALLAIGTQAADLPIANEKNCTPGVNFVQFNGSTFVRDCKKFGRGFVSNYVGCLFNGKLVPLGEQVDSASEYKLGYRMSCDAQNSNGIKFGPIGCIIGGGFVDFGHTKDEIDKEADRAYRLECVKDEKGNISIESRGCMLAPGTSDEVFFNLGELKKIDPINQYCKCSTSGWSLSCANEAKYLSKK